jgi:tRNA1(Val) A37 N6-methylase TrmN6
MAAQKFHAQAVGIELNKDLAKLSSDKIRKLKLEQTAHIVNGDLLKQDYSSADLVTVYLFPGFIDKVRPLLDQQLKKGARVVAHDFEFKNWTPEQVENIADDGEGRSHTLFLYRK